MSNPADARLVIIGDSPGSHPPEHPLASHAHGSSGRRLLEYTGLDATVTPAVNLFFLEPPRWSAPAARLAAIHLEPLLSRRLVVLLGARVAGAFRHVSSTFSWEWHRSAQHGFWAVRLPHPSGQNRELNDKQMTLDTRACLSMLPGIDDPDAEQEVGSPVHAESVSDLLVRVGDRLVLHPPFEAGGRWTCTVEPNPVPTPHTNRRSVLSRDDVHLVQQEPTVHS